MADFKDFDGIPHCRFKHILRQHRRFNNSISYILYTTGDTLSLLLVSERGPPCYQKSTPTTYWTNCGFDLNHSVLQYNVVQIQTIVHSIRSRRRFSIERWYSFWDKNLGWHTCCASSLSDKRDQQLGRRCPYIDFLGLIICSYTLTMFLGDHSLLPQG